VVDGFGVGVIVGIFEGLGERYVVGAGLKETEGETVGFVVIEGEMVFLLEFGEAAGTGVAIMDELGLATGL
jgi:hypothetical protein